MSLLLEVFRFIRLTPRQYMYWDMRQAVYSQAECKIMALSQRTTVSNQIFAEARRMTGLLWLDVQPSTGLATHPIWRYVVGADQSS